jgi:hypothetical protein
MKNKIAVRLMEAGVSYNKQKLHKAGYFRELLASKPTSTMGGGPCCVCAAKWWFGEKDRERFGAVSGTSRIAAGTNRAAHDHPGGWPDHGADLGIGGWRRKTLFIDQEGHQLLRTVWRREKIGRHDSAHTTVQATQQALADDSNRGGQVSAEKQPGPGDALSMTGKRRRTTPIARRWP